MTDIINDSNISDKLNSKIIVDLPWVEKYRPDKISNIIAHEQILNTLSTLMEKNNFPHVIFYGPPGTGKTTTILACAKHMYGDSYTNMVLELNGSDDRGINVVREQIKDFSQSEIFSNEVFNVNKKKHKLVVLDEADSMTYDAQFALRRVIETYTNTTRFCLICNYSTKIIPSLQSRCITFRFSPIPILDHIKHIEKIVKLEKINTNTEVINEIIKLSDGDMRKSLNILQSLHMTCGHTSLYERSINLSKGRECKAFSNFSEGHTSLSNFSEDYQPKEELNNDYSTSFIDLDSLYKNIGYPLPKEKKLITETIIKSDIITAFNYVKKLEEQKSLSLNDILNELVSYIITNKVYTPIKTARIISKLSEIEYYLAGNINTSIQLGAIISILKSV
jgi:replication factor C subunit 3/5